MSTPVIFDTVADAWHAAPVLGRETPMKDLRWLLSRTGPALASEVAPLIAEALDLPEDASYTILTAAVVAGAIVTYEVDGLGVAGLYVAAA